MPAETAVTATKERGTIPVRGSTIGFQREEANTHSSPSFLGVSEKATLEKRRAARG